jgi:hypothetical protein
MHDTHQVTVTLSRPLSLDHRIELERHIFFVSSVISGFEVLADGEAIHGVRLQTDEPVAADEISRKLNFVVDNDIAGQRFVPGRVVWSSPQHRETQDDVYERLQAAGEVTELGDGQVALGPLLLRLSDWIDERLAEIVRDEIPATVEYRYPTLLPTRVLEAAGYFSSFPQYLMFVTRLHSDIDTYRDFQREFAAAGRLEPRVLGQCENVDYCLPPTMCFHTFGQHRGRALGTDDLTVITAKGKSFRFESRYSASLERLWDFTIRETVVMGRRAEVLAARGRLMERALAFVDSLGLAGHCEVANDPFFCEPDATPARIYSQRLMELKYELRLAISGGRTVAVGSFNFHDDFFGRSFDISLANGDRVSSACTGFGIERFTYAFLCQHGSDPAHWPATVTAAVCGKPSGEAL